MTALVVLIVDRGARRRLRRDPARRGCRRRSRRIAPTALAALAAVSIPFVVEGHFGVLGTGFNVDMSQHLFAADWLADPRGAEPEPAPQRLSARPARARGRGQRGDRRAQHRLHGRDDRGPGHRRAHRRSRRSIDSRALRGAARRRPDRRSPTSSPPISPRAPSRSSSRRPSCSASRSGSATSTRARERAAGGLLAGSCPARVIAAGAALRLQLARAWPGSAATSRSGRRRAVPARADAGAVLRRDRPAGARRPRPARRRRARARPDRQVRDERRAVTERTRARCGWGPTGPVAASRAAAAKPERPDTTTTSATCSARSSRSRCSAIWPSGDFRVKPGDGAVPAPVFYLGALLGASCSRSGVAAAGGRRETALLAALAARRRDLLAARVGSTPYTNAKALQMLAPLRDAARSPWLLDPLAPLPLRGRSPGARSSARVRRGSGGCSLPSPSPTPRSARRLLAGRPQARQPLRRRADAGARLRPAVIDDQHGAEFYRLGAARRRRLRRASTVAAGGRRGVRSVSPGVDARAARSSAWRVRRDATSLTTPRKPAIGEPASRRRPLAGALGHEGGRNSMAAMARRSPSSCPTARRSSCPRAPPAPTPRPRSGPGLAKAALAISVDGELRDLAAPLRRRRARSRSSPTATPRRST